MPDLREEFNTLASHEPLPLARAALLVAKQEYSALNVEHYLRRLDELAAAAQAWAPPGSPAGRAQGLSRFLFEHCGFAGNEISYGDPRNSFLNEVLERKLGIPITLSVLYLEIGWRLGMALEGVSFPGHFLVKLSEDGADLIVDPFNRGVLLTRAELQARVAQASGRDVRLGPEALRGATTRQIVVRMLRNLKHIYVAAADWPRAVAALDRMLMLQPRALDELLERAKLYEMLECFQPALEDLQSFLRIAPDHPVGDAVRDKIIELSRTVARIS